MFTIVGAGLWLSIFQQSPIDRWISFLMIIFILLHLAEANSPFRSLEISIFPLIPSFEHESGRIEIEVYNPTEIASTVLRLKLRKHSAWAHVPSVPPKSRRLVPVTIDASAPGRHPLPALIIESYPATRLFRLWKVLKADESFAVLPQAKDHGVLAQGRIADQVDAELSHIESILDERLLYKMDHKLFLKTGKAYYRKSESISGDESVQLNWSALASMPEIERNEQFSAWIKTFSTALRSRTPSTHEPQFTASSGARRRPSDPLNLKFSPSTVVTINAPFVQIENTAVILDWDDVKTKYAEWLYVEAKT